VFIEQLEKNPGKYLPEVTSESLSSDVVEVSLSMFFCGILGYILLYGYLSYTVNISIDKS